jgi:nitrogen regulatory protein PII
MKKLEAIVPHNCVHSLVEQLHELNIKSVSISNVNVVDEHSSHTMIYRGCVYKEDSASRAKIEFYVADENAARAEEVIEYVLEAQTVG